MTENEHDKIISTDSQSEIDLCEDSTNALLNKYEKSRKQKTDDIFAMQAVLCVLLAALLFGFNFMYPQMCEAVYNKVIEAVNDKNELIPNPIDVLIQHSKT